MTKTTGTEIYIGHQGLSTEQIMGLNLVMQAIMIHGLISGYELVVHEEQAVTDQTIDLLFTTQDATLLSNCFKAPIYAISSDILRRLESIANGSEAALTILESGLTHWIINKLRDDVQTA